MINTNKKEPPFKTSFLKTLYGSLKISFLEPQILHPIIAGKKCKKNEIIIKEYPFYLRFREELEEMGITLLDFEDESKLQENFDKIIKPTVDTINFYTENIYSCERIAHTPFHLRTKKARKILKNQGINPRYYDIIYFSFTKNKKKTVK